MISGNSGIMGVAKYDAGAVLEAPASATPEASPMHTDSTPTHKSCTRCGETKPLGEFYTAKRGLYGRRSQCKRCVSNDRNAYNKQKRRENPEVFRKQSREYYYQNRERLIADAIEYHRGRRWYQRYSWRKRRAERMGVAIVDLTSDQWWACLEYFGNRCAYCHEPLTEDGQDHIVPVSMGGNHTINNVVPACRSCNARKNSLSLLECLVKGRL